MPCHSCGKEQPSNAMYCDECMVKNLQAAIHPAGEAPTYVPPASDPSGPEFIPESFPGQETPARSPMVGVVMGIVAFAFTVVVVCIGYAAYNGVRAPSDAIVVIPDNPSALLAAQNDRGLLHIYKPGDTWTFQFNRQDEEGGGIANETGEIVEKIVGSSINGRPCLIDTATLQTVDANGNKTTSKYISCSRQEVNGDMYLLAYGSDKPEKLHWNAKPELIAKGDWNTDPSFDFPTETSAGTPSHTFVSVSPDPVVMKLSTGTPVKCWNKTITVTAGDNFDQTTDELYCPAIGQKISSKDTVIFPDKRTRTTTINLTHFSLR